MDNQIKMHISLKQNKVNIGSPSVVVNTGGGGVEPTGVIDITENGEYNVKYYAGANVNVPIPEGYIIPEGTFSAAKVGTYNVTEYAEAEFSVETETKEFTPTEEEQVYQPDEDVYITSVKVNPIPEQYIVPEGRIEVNKVGDYDVTSYAEASFSVEVESKEFTPTEVTQEYTPPVDVYISSVKVNPIPEQYIVPSGNIDIVDTNSVDVTSYASAQIKDENLKPENIAENVEVLGITGTFRGGIDTSDGTITADKVLKDEIGYAKEEKIVGTIETYDYSASEDVQPEIDKLLENELIEIYNDRITTLRSNAFASSNKLVKVYIPNVEAIPTMAFNTCSSLKIVDISNAKTISGSPFQACSRLLRVIIRQTNKVCAMQSAGVFSTCYRFVGAKHTTYNPDGLKDGYIYVPDELVEDYKVATNWSAYADQIKPLSEYVEEVE